MRILSLNHPGFMKELYTRNYIINQCHPNIYNLKNQWEKVKFKSNRNEIQLKICGKNSFVDYQNVTFLNCSYKKNIFWETSAYVLSHTTYDENAKTD